MKIKALFASMGAVAASALLSAPAMASMVAGWDFSQYASDGVLQVDGVNFTTTLDANYSNLDPTFGAGAEAATFGRMYINGSFGSTAVVPTGLNTEQFLPTAGSLASNVNAPVTSPGLAPFDSLTILQAEGQIFANEQAMTALGVANVVFQANLGAQPVNGSDWSVSFAGKTFSGSSSVGIEFSTDGASYASFGSASLDTNDKPFSVNLGAVSSHTAFVRLSFNPAAGQPIIDNLAISGTLTAVPEPGTALLIVSGLAGLQIFGRRRA